MSNAPSNLDELIDLASKTHVASVEAENDVSRLDIAGALDMLDLKFKQEELAGKKQDREQRRRFALNIFWVVVSYLALVLAILILNGFSLVKITDTVLITLLGTTTANVISLLVIVAKYLFHTKE